MILSETAGLEDYRAQLGPVATSIIEVHKMKAGPGHCIVKERAAVGRRCLRLRCRRASTRQWPPFSVIITAARPVAVVGKNSSMRLSNCTAFAISASGIGLIALDGDELSVSPAGAVRTVARSDTTGGRDRSAALVVDLALGPSLQQAAFSMLMDTLTGRA